MAELENPTYYAIIPATVRYDNDLKANEKLLYAEITALSSKTGECWASDGYFANLYDVDRSTVNRWVSHLAEKGYITKQVIYKENSKEIEKRIIKIATPIDNSAHPIDKKINTPIDKKVTTPIDKKITDNNININNININNRSENTLSVNNLKSKDNSINNKDILEYINNLEYSLDFKELLKKWFTTIGKKLTLQQLQSKLNTLYKDCSNNIDLMYQQILYSYNNGYIAFYAPKKDFKKKPSFLTHHDAGVSVPRLSEMDPSEYEVF